MQHAEGIIGNLLIKTKIGGIPKLGIPPIFFMLLTSYCMTCGHPPRNFFISENGTMILFFLEFFETVITESEFDAKNIDFV